MTCTGPGCSRPAARAQLCWGHLRQARRHGILRPLEPRGQIPWDRVREAAIALADAETDDELRRAEERLRAAVVAYSQRRDQRSAHPGG